MRETEKAFSIVQSFEMQIMECATQFILELKSTYTTYGEISKAIKCIESSLRFEGKMDSLIVISKAKKMLEEEKNRLLVAGGSGDCIDHAVSTDKTEDVP